MKAFQPRLNAIHFAVAAIVMIVAGLFLPSCADEDAAPMASARVVASTDDMIGGNSALGEIGDFLLENDKIRVIIQGPGYSRGSGVFGGQLLDIDLRRASEEGEAGRGTGRDSFGELFPAFFIQAVAVDEVEITADGSDGGPASITARGAGGDFFTMLGVLNRAALGSHDDYLDPESDPRLRYETIYELNPGDQFLTIRFRVKNISQYAIEFPGADAVNLLRLLGINLEGFTVPVGDVALFGATSPMFVPGAGFGLRYSLRDAYQRGVEFPAFPGFVTDWMASNGDEVSYGLFIPESDNNYVFNKFATYDDGISPITRSSLLIFLEASGFFGVFEFDGPVALEPEEEWEIVKYFAVGSGDVGSVLDVINDVNDVSTGRVGGTVTDVETAAPCLDCSILVYQRLEGDARRIYSQYDPRSGGRFSGTLAAGEYSARVLGDGRALTDFVDFTIRSGRTTGLELTANSPGRIVVTIMDSDGRLLPARATAVGTYGEEHIGEETRDFLFDVHAGQGWHYSDMVPDTEDPETRRYIEDMEPTLNGRAELLVRPGTYFVYSSRGLEYDLVRTEVSVGPGETVSVVGTLTHVVDTTGWIAGDMHIHTINSVDAEVTLDDRVLWLAGEGIEWAVSSDHNYVTNFGPNIVENGLVDWMVSTVGIELTTLDGGHFNAYPIEYTPGPITHGSFEWSFLPPGEIFSRLRDLGKYGPDQTVVQVNHPRDTLLGYFNQHRLDPLTAEWVEPSFFGSYVAEYGPAFYDENGDSTYSLEFDALEVFNGSHTEFLHHYRVPEVLPDGEFPDDLPPVGSILVDGDGAVLFPGGVDDWYNYLNLDERFVAVGTSDTHHDSDPDGYARTMVYVDEDDPRGITELEIVRSLKAGRATATNGPMISFYINDPTTGAMGEEIIDRDGTVSLTMSVTAAPWVGVGRVNVVRNGLIAHVIEIEANRDLAANPLVETLEIDLETDEETGEPRDSWFAVEAIGYRSLFPVIWPYEVPPIIITDAIGSLAEPLGMGETEYGDLKPALAFPVTAYGLANPVWVITDGDEFSPPGIVPLRLRDEPGEDPGINTNPFGYAMTAGPQNPERVRDVAVAPRLREAPVRLFQRDPGNPFDIRRIFAAYNHH